MSVFCAQFFQLVRRKINNDDSSARFQNSARLKQGTLRVIKIMQHLMDGNQISARIRKWQCLNISLPHLRILKARHLEIGACDS